MSRELQANLTMVSAGETRIRHYSVMLDLDKEKQLLFRDGHLFCHRCELQERRAASPRVRGWSVLSYGIEIMNFTATKMAGR